MSDHDTVVVRDGGSGGAMILALVVLVIVVAAGWYFLMGPGAGSTTNAPGDVNVEIQLPSPSA
ncbi:MAG: hypothetical protein AB1627_10930 [Chloroflexota bacterium]